MCGIAASYPPDPDFTAMALSAQQRRGPDGTARVDLGFCELGINRLAITGADAGAQPLMSEDGSVTVVFNGAIYNVEDLVRRLAIRRLSGNDGDVIPALYQRFGLRFADHLEGMFAICIADSARRQLVVAVDPVGIKPMYRCDMGGTYVASALAAFPRRLWPNVYRVPPGSVWASSGETREIRRVYHNDHDLGTLLAASVAEQVPREVDWACMLSGGVDSSVIARLAVDCSSDVHTITCGTRDGEDLDAARDVANVLNTTHHEVIVDPHELPALVEAVVVATASCDAGIVLSGVGTYVVARAAREAGIKVLLSGEGADELFGGYAHDTLVPQAFLNAALLQSQVDLGATECLRLDRTSMEHGVESRVPFLSTSIIRHARELPPHEKIRPTGDRFTTKHALRRFAATVLPANVAFRDKVGLAEGSGVTREIARLAAERYPAYNVAALRSAFPSFPITDAPSAWFFACWLHHFGPDLAVDWASMVDRGLARQRASRYLPNVRESMTYVDDASVDRDGCP